MNIVKDNLKLFDNQKHHVGFLVKKRKAIVFDKTGSGKTITCLYAYAVLRSHNLVTNLLVLTPKSAYEKKVWLQDIQKFFNLRAIDLDTFVKRVTTSNESVEHLLKIYHVVYCKHSHVKQVGEIINQICESGKVLTVVDEVHQLKNPNSSLTQNMRLYIRNTYALWTLTASPLSKNLEDTYNIINFTYPWYLGSFTDFKRRYCRVEQKVIGRGPGGRLRKAEVITGFSNEEAFLDKIKDVAVQGESYLKPNFYYLDYELNDLERSLYTKVARGITLDDSIPMEEWLQKTLSESDIPEAPIKDISRFSSRFIYLQSACDGTLTPEGNQNNTHSTKINILVNKIKEIVSKKESVLVYFDYYVALNAVRSRIEELKLDIVILESSGSHTLSAEDVTERRVKIKPHVILCTKASSESASYYFINNLIFFQIPTVPSVFVQMTGRIVRKNTLFPNNIQVGIFRSDNIDLYKLWVVSSKCAQMEVVSGKETNIPEDYKEISTKKGLLEKQKKLLLWKR